MNRFTCPHGFEDALLRRAEQYEEQGALREAKECRRLAGRTRRTGSRRGGKTRGVSGMPRPTGSADVGADVPIGPY